jgi:beta-glucosidase
MEVLYPFGYGLSYTVFDYSDLRLAVKNTDNILQADDKRSMMDTDLLEVSLKVKNIGTVRGKEVVQLYVKDLEASVNRPPKELKGFIKVDLEPGEEKTVTFTLDKRSFAYYSTQLGDWYAESGIYEILIGKSSREIVLKASVELHSSVKLPLILDDRTTYADIINGMDNPQEFINLLLGAFGNAQSGGTDTGEGKMFIEMMKSMPLHAVRSFTSLGLPVDKIDALLKPYMDKK